MRINVYLDQQRLELIDTGGEVVCNYPVSTALNGAGELYGSECTPRGLHIVRAKIGDGAAVNTVFVARRPTGEVWSPELAAAQPLRDWMLTRILWLSGREVGFNRLGRVDSMRRKIYIHGTGDDASLNAPRSHGCIRMKNIDMIDLFDRIPAGVGVDIAELSGRSFRVRMARWEEDHPMIRGIRHEVFVEEQKVPDELEWDGADASCRHVLAEDCSGRVIGTARLLNDGHIGRVAVRLPWRGRGVGAAMILRLCDVARYAGFQTIALNAQIQTLEFYGRFGFSPVGLEFMEAGILHRAMERILTPLPARKRRD